jgi:hypothetical protein
MLAYDGIVYKMINDTALAKSIFSTVMKMFLK